MNITPIRNQYLDAKRAFNLSIAESITEILSGVSGRTHLDEDLDIVIIDGVNRVYTASPIVSINVRLNQPVADIVAQGDYSLEILYNIPLTPVQVELYHKLNAAFYELAQEQLALFKTWLIKQYGHTI